MTASFTLLHRATFVAPLGFRFWDVVEEAAVRDGLQVTVALKDLPERVYPAFPNPSGIYIVRGLPGMRRFERGLLPDGSEIDNLTAFWAAWQVKPLKLVVTVSDPQGRYLPVQFDAQAPTQGIFDLTCNPALPVTFTPQATLPHVPLFSTAGRLLPAKRAAIYADLRVNTSSVPAAWAWVEARHQGVLLARGMSDRDGRAALFFAYPEVTMLTVTSPLTSPLGTSVPLEAQTWQIDVTAGYTALVAPATPPDVPDLCAVLRQSPISNPMQVQLQYGQPSVVRSSQGGQPLSVWRIAPV